MSTPTWGLLKKSQVDNETIEEAIDRLIQAHDDDETSHLGTGQSLQSHKASEIIDHLIDSIVADKIRAMNIDPTKLIVDKNYMPLALESIDAFGKTATGAGASIALNRPGSVRINVGDSIGDKSYLYSEAPIFGFSSAKNSFFQCTVSEDEELYQDYAFCMGNNDPFSDSDDMYGIEYDQSDNKVYGFYVYHSGAVYTKVRVELFSGHSLLQIWRAEWYPDDDRLDFYINGVFVDSLDTSAHAPNFLADYICGFGGKNIHGVDNWYTIWQSVILYFDN